MNKEKLSKILLVAGILMFVIGIFVLKDSSVFAATPYGEKYTVTEWRRVRAVPPGECLSSTPSKSTTWVTLGPAKWHIEGNVGGTGFSEDWWVPGGQSWDNGIQVWGGSVGANICYQYDTVIPAGNYINTNAGAGWTPFGEAPSGNYKYAILPTGLYGAWVVNAERAQLSYGEYSSLHSWPKEWEVAGSINMP